jgi:hypothetical protein
MPHIKMKPRLWLPQWRKTNARKPHVNRSLVAAHRVLAVVNAIRENIDSPYVSSTHRVLTA